jgi:hypothetical protein
LTDERGGYEIGNLPAGRFQVVAIKTGYLMLGYRARRPNGGGKHVDVGPGEVVAGVDFSLPRGGVLTGHVTDEHGEPLTGMQVQARRA